MDYEKEYKEALERAKAGKPMDEVFPELKESKDERIRKELIDFLKGINLRPAQNPRAKEEFIAYLEKQKEQKPALRLVGDGLYSDPNSHFELEDEQKPAEEELVYRLNGLMQDYIKEGKDEAEKEHRLKCYRLFWDALEDTNFFEQKEQKPNIELIQRSWYMEGYHDREFGQEPKWVIKTGEGGPRYEKNEKYGQPLEQKHELCDMGRWDEESYNNGIHHVLHNPEAYGLTKQKPVEWNEEDKRAIDRACVALRAYSNGELPEFLPSELLGYADRLQSLRNRPKSSDNWKPSEEQMGALNYAYCELFKRGDVGHNILGPLQNIIDTLSKL